jgi:transcriptional regulator with XRE-family HTH domain
VTGDHLRHLRRTKLKLTQVQLAQRLGVTVTSVARWERDERVMSAIADRFVRVLAELQTGTSPALVARVARVLASPATRGRTARTHGRKAQ